ncbi:MAG: hydroxypyruvate isomerase family protein [Jhaorihella sp.]
MPRFAANLSLLFTELPYLDRFAAAATAGFAGVEVLFPYDMAAEETRRALLASGLELVLMNAPPPSHAGATPGFAALPGGEARFRHDMHHTLRFAEVLRPSLIHVMAGYTKDPGAEDVFVANLRWLAGLAPAQKFTVEPLNPGDQPGYFLDDYDLAVRLLDRVDRANVGLQFDSYHAQVIHGDAQGIWERYGGRAFHVQIGQTPDRSEPGPGPIDFAALFAAIDAGGYAGWVSAEYHPRTPGTSNSLGWMR